MKNILILIFCLLTFFNVSNGQISQGGIPISFGKNTTLSLNENIPTQTLPGIDVERLISEDLLNDNNKNIPWRFGENIPVDIDIKADAVLDLLQDGSKLWRLRIYAPGALSMNFRFDNYFLPQGAKLFFYNDLHTKILGAFTNFNNQADRVFATTLIEGDAIILEYYEPANVLFTGELHIDQVTHGYRNIFDFLQKGFGSSGSCNNNVVCPEAAGWENEIRSACMLVVNGNGFCSGSLVNNTSNDGTPYVLTANHCSGSNNFSSWVFWFNWQSGTCENPASSPAYNSISGSVLISRYATSDFCLVQMNQTPPQEYNVFYAGWSKEGLVSPSAVCIHHPRGDIKKITFANNPTVAAIYNNVDSWQALWTDGATEPGSSGSPLFDKDHRIIGQLYGGPSSCTAAPEYMNDYYGKFSVSWEGASPDVRLKDWLDPLNINPPYIDGYDPNTPTYSLDAKPKTIDVPIASYCGLQSISPAVKIQNAGATTLNSLKVKYSINGGAFTDQIWTGNLTSGAIALVTFPSLTLSLGNHIFTVVTENPNGQADENTTNDTLTKNFSVSIGASLPFIENFENTVFPPADWTILNPDGSITWDHTTLAAGNGTSTGSACISLRGYTGTGQIDGLVLPKINMETVSNATMTFKVAYRRYSTQTSDRLKIYISTDCGLSFNTVIYDKAGSTLATGPDMTTAFFPLTAEDWRTETINLTPYIGNTIQLKFECINQNGNNLFIDDINIQNNMAPGALFTCYDTSSCTGVISFIDQSYGFPENWLWDFGDGETSTSQNPTHTYSSSGDFSVSLTVSNSFGSTIYTKTNLIHINLPDAPVTVSTSRCGEGSVILNASATGSLYWFDAPSGGTQVGMGNQFTTPYLSSTTSYYVENRVGLPSLFFGNMDSTTNGGNANLNAEYWLNFEVLVPLRLVSVVVNSAAEAYRTIYLRNSNGINLDSVVLNIPFGVNRIYLNLDLQPGFYQLVGAKNANLWRNNAGINYPYTIPGMISITSSNVNNRYYHFYEWEIQEPGCVSTRSEATAIISPSLTAGAANISSSEICSGESVSLTLDTYSGNIQWQQSLDGITGWTNISNAVTDSFYTGAILSDLWFRAHLSGDGCQDVYSNIVSVVVSEGSQAGPIQASQSVICSGDSIEFSIENYTGIIQWQASADGIIFSDLPGETAEIYNTGALTESLYVRAFSILNNCPLAFSDTILITVNEPAIAGELIAEPADICEGETSTLYVSGSVGAIKWMESTDSINWTEIINATDTVYQTPMLNQEIFYQVIATQQGCPDAISSTISVTPHAPPTGSINASNASYGNNDGFASVTITGGTGSFSYLWSDGQITPNVENLAPGTYDVTVTDGICTINFSCTIEENPSIYPTANFNVNDQLICTGMTVQFTDMTSNNPLTWQWYFPGGNPASSNNQNPSVTYNNIGAFNVILKITNQFGSDSIVKSNYITVTSPGTLSFAVTNESAPNATDGSITVNVIGGNPPYTYYWSNGGTSQSISGLTADVYSVAVYDASGCFVTSPVTLDVNVGIPEFDNNKNISIYPNPVNDKLIMHSGDNKIHKIEITDVSGKLLKIYEDEAIRKEYDVSFLSNGIYLFRIHTNKNIKQIKVVVAR